MKRLLATLIFISVLILAASIIVQKFSIGYKKQTDIVFIGPEENVTTFSDAGNSGQTFYDLYGKARISEKAGDYQNALKLLNKSLPFIGIGLERSMVYKKLAEIYRKQGNLEKELFYIEEFPKYSMNKELNQEAKLRASQIRQLLAEKKWNIFKKGVKWSSPVLLDTWFSSAQHNVLKNLVCPQGCLGRGTTQP